MYAQYISTQIIRGLRTPTKRAVSAVLKTDNVDKPVIPLNEHDLKKLKERDERMDYEEFEFKPLAERMNIHDEEKSKEAIPPKKFLMKEKKKSTFIKLKDFVLKHPLVDAPTEENQYKRLSTVVTPLYMIPYQKQLKMKQRHCEDSLKELRRKLKEVGAPVTTTRERLPCPVENIIPSPDLMQYRNKDEFSVHVGVDGNPKTVGYYLGLPSDPLMRCISPSNIIIIKDSHKLVAKHFECFIRSSPHASCLKFHDGGVWRNIVVRSNLKEELMAVVTVFPGQLSPEEYLQLKHDLRHYFFQGPGAECSLSSLYVQACSHSKCTREMSPFELIEGKSHLEENCLGRTFRISPDSFFQTNTRAAELLYSSIEKVAELSELTTLLDVCCGTGTISVMLAPQCRGAIGIDAIQGSIEDAKINAKQNEVHNINYIQGKIEIILPILTRDLEDSSDVVAVVNPARAGLHPSVIQSLRECDSIKKLIFVTCKPEGNAMMNMAMLGSTLSPKDRKWGRRMKNYQSKEGAGPLCDPFILRYAIPIDLFPHTLHVENVFLFERISHF